ncbi:MAG: methyl-accepting chemotaxis protein [Acidobacteria bacterium]|nr:MAG: methyl-accepting chemotaxis protein [Acidobacteriota bacterium]
MSIHMNTAASFFQRLSVARKLLLSSLAFALPFAVLLYFVVAGFDGIIRLTSSEIQGARLLPAVQALFEGLGKLEVASDAASADAAKVEQAQTGVEQAINDLAQWTAAVEDQQSRAALSHVEKAWPEWRDQWQKARAGQGSAPTSMMPEAVGFLRKMGDESQLILDPDLDSYYLMNLALVRLPRLQENLQQVLLYALSAEAAGGFQDYDRRILLGYAVNLDRLLAELRDDLAIPLQVDERFYGKSVSLHQRIPVVMKRLEDSVKTVVRQSRDLAQRRSTPGPKTDLSQSTTQALESGYGLWRVTGEELVALLEARLAFHQMRRGLAILLSVVSLAVAGGLVLLISRGITVPLRRATRIAGHIADGQLRQAKEALAAGTYRYNGAQASNDESWRLSQAMERMLNNLDSLLNQVGGSSEQVTLSAAHITESVLQLEATVAQQAASTSEVTATSREISSTVSGLAQTVGRVTETASQAADLAAQGMTSLGEIKATLQSLHDASTDVSGRLEVLREKTASINQVITTITRVANLTNLLSLNAAIEAEKAGEYGAGFAVVAREVRRLADQTAVAALDIEGVISEMQNAVREGVAGVECYTEQARLSTERIARISNDLSRIIEYATQLSPQLETVNHGMQDQSASASQISEAMSQLDEAARQTRESLHGFLQVTDRLHAAAKGLETEVDRFVLT